MLKINEPHKGNLQALLLLPVFLQMGFAQRRRVSQREVETGQNTRPRPLVPS